MRASTISAAMCALFITACGAAPSPGQQGGALPAHASGHPGTDQSQPRRHQHAHGAQHDFHDVETFARVFDDPERDAWQKPAEVVRIMGIAPGMVVADLGAGTGYFLRHLSQAVGPDGRVLALDVELAMVEHMRERIERERLGNVEARLAAMDDPGLDGQLVDRVLVVNTWHHIAGRSAYAARLRSALEPGGRVVVVDFTIESQHGPPPEMRLPPEKVMQELQAGGLEPEILHETLPNQYIVQGRRRPTAPR